MELELVLGPKAGFNKWNEHKWRSFLISPDIIRIKYGDWDSLTGLLDTVCYNLEEKSYGSVYPVFQQIAKGDFFGWNNKDLNQLMQEIDFISKRLQPLPAANQIKRKNSLDVETEVTNFTGENETNKKDKNGKNLYEINKFYLDTLLEFAAEARSKSMGIILLPKGTISYEKSQLLFKGFKGSVIGATNIVESKVTLDARFRSGANWFYWIAGLSIINSLIMMFKGNMSFIIGLGITQFIDAIILDLEIIPDYVALIFDFLFVGIFALFGLFANKRHKWAFITGMILYALDGLLFLLVKDFLSIGFHVFALFNIFMGLKALNKLKTVE